MLPLNLTRTAGSLRHDLLSEMNPVQKDECAKCVGGGELRLKVIKHQENEAVKA